MLVGLKRHGGRGRVFWSVTCLIVIAGLLIAVEAWTDSIMVLDHSVWVAFPWDWSHNVQVGWVAGKFVLAWNEI
ncbi:MAG TPA: hypothetical protein VFW65_38215 [Pseudonocardiaceae bacterium]|nr:hypothetical protein [Pseudonocardiaceae bacterium]